MGAFKRLLPLVGGTGHQELAPLLVNKTGAEVNANAIAELASRLPDGARV